MDYSISYSERLDFPDAVWRRVWANALGVELREERAEAEKEGADGVDAEGAGVEQARENERGRAGDEGAEDLQRGEA